MDFEIGPGPRQEALSDEAMAELAAHLGVLQENRDYDVRPESQPCLKWKFIFTFW